MHSFFILENLKIYTGGISRGGKITLLLTPLPPSEKIREVSVPYNYAIATAVFLYTNTETSYLISSNKYT